MRKLVVLLSLAVLPLTAAPAHAAAPPCFPKGATRLVANHDVRVYWIDRAAGEVYYGCFKGTGRTTRLGTVGSADDADTPFIEEVRLNGRFVAFNDGCSCQGSAQPEGMSVIDLRRGRRMHRAEFAHGSSIDDVVVSPSGSAALIVTLATVREVRAFEGKAVSGPGRLVDSGLGIEQESLRLKGSTLSWNRDGARRSDRLR
jgi:hypothetical protein